MGNSLPCGSLKRQTEPSITPAEASKMTNTDLDQYLAKKQQTKERVKLLLIGPGDSGKSTLFKQMKILYSRDYGPKMLKQEKNIIFSAFLNNFQELLKLVDKDRLIADGLDDHTIEVIEDCKAKLKSDSDIRRRILWQDDDEEMLELAHEFATVWRIQSVQTVYRLQALNPNIPDSLPFFADKIEEFCAKDYLPSEQDFLLSRVRTAGAQEQHFLYHDVEFHIIDMGGQRAERNKWMRYFDEVTATIFVASLSDFDKVLYEKENQNSLEEAVDLFKKTSNSLLLKEVPFILFLNKMDLLHEKLITYRDHLDTMSLETYFPTLKIEEGFDVDSVEEQIKHIVRVRFEEAGGTGRLFTHFVTAINKDIFSQVFDSTARIILTNTMNKHFSGQPKNI